MILRLALLCLVIAAPAAGQEPIPYRWTSHEEVPARISDALVTAQISASIWEAWHADHPGRAFVHDACAAGATVLAAEVIKRVVKRDRPNHYDNKSTPSMHTGVATSLAGWRPAWGASFAIGVGWGRGASGWHYTSDVALGALLGYTAGRVCPWNDD